MNVNYNKIFPILLFCVCLFSCSTEETETPSKSIVGYEFFAEIEGFGSSATRANIVEGDDNWSYRSFSKGDVAGFYSQYGNPDTPDGNGSFNNVPMYYGNNSFYNNDINFVTDNFVARSTFYYYPYHENIDYDSSHTEFLNDDYGLELRIKDEDGIERCRDLVWVFSASSVNSIKFGHAFSSIVFLRGEGFDKPQEGKKDIKVYLNKGVSHVTIGDTSEDYLKNTYLVYLNGYKIDEENKSEEDCKVWEAWQGATYTVDVKTGGAYAGDTFEDAYYVILPTTRTTSRLTVDHIELYDNDGKLQKISNFTLYTSGSNTKILYYGQRYPLVIKMQGLEPTISPIGIQPWEDDINIEDTREAGINSVEDFSSWATNYSAYLAGHRQNNYDVELGKYGDKTEMANGSVKWKFYINSNLDFKEYITNQNLARIFSKLDDILEGNNKTITGLTVNFAEELGENGVIQNLNFKGLNINDTNTDASAKGGLFSICKGKISGCDIDGVVSSYGSVGLIAAEGDGATIEGCKLSGMVIGDSSENGIFGSVSKDCNLINNNTSSLIIQTNN